MFIFSEVAPDLIVEEASRSLWNADLGLYKYKLIDWSMDLLIELWLEDQNAQMEKGRAEIVHYFHNNQLSRKFLANRRN